MLIGTTKSIGFLATEAYWYEGAVPDAFWNLRIMKAAEGAH